MCLIINRVFSKFLLRSTKPNSCQIGDANLNWIKQYKNVSILQFIGVKGDGGGESRVMESRVMEVVVTVGVKGDGGGGNSWSDKTCKALVKMLPSTNKHPVFFTGRVPFLSPNQQCQSTEGKHVMPTC